MGNVALVQVSWFHDLVREFMFSQQVDEHTEDHIWYSSRGNLLGRQIWYIPGRCYTDDDPTPVTPEIESVILRMIELYREMEWKLTEQEGKKMKSAVYPMQDIIGSEKAASVDTTTDIERTEIVNGLLISHRAKGGDYVVRDVVTPAGDDAKKLGVIVTYADAKNGNVYYRPIEDFMKSMVKTFINPLTLEK